MNPNFIVMFSIGALFGTFLISRLFLWFMRSWEGGILRLLAAHSISLIAISVLAGMGMADRGEFAGDRALILYSGPQLFWLLFDILWARLKIKRAEKEKSAANKTAKIETPKVETPKFETPKVETPKVETEAESDKIAAAHQLGQDFGNDFAKNLDAFLVEHYTYACERHLHVFRGQIEKTYGATDAPPLWAARAEYKNFVEHLGEKFKPQIISDSKKTFHESLDAADVIESRDVFQALIESRAEDIEQKMKLDGFEIVKEHSKRLAEVDEKWREAYPDLAAKFPKD